MMPTCEPGCLFVLDCFPEQLATTCAEGCLCSSQGCFSVPECLQVRRLVQTSDPDPSMYGALPPGAWWEVANGADPVFEQYADKAGDAAVVAARSGDLELVNVSFSYPVRKEMAGALGASRPLDTCTDLFMTYRAA